LTGTWSWPKPRHTARDASGLFFPQRVKLGLDSRQLTPELVTKITIAGVKDRSEVEAAKTLEDIGGVKVSPKTVERVLHDVGEEVTQLRDCPPSRLSRTLVPKPPADAPQRAERGHPLFAVIRQKRLVCDLWEECAEWVARLGGKRQWRRIESRRFNDGASWLVA